MEEKTVFEEMGEFMKKDSLIQRLNNYSWTEFDDDEIRYLVKLIEKDL